MEGEQVGDEIILEDIDLGRRVTSNGRSSQHYNDTPSEKMGTNRPRVFGK
jgi:hypothetical protein